MIGSSRYANLLIDTADRLARAGDDRQAWQAVVEITEGIGAKAVSAGALTRDCRSIVWMRSSASAEWFEDYSGHELYRVDPLRRAAMAGRMPAFLDAAQARPGRDEPMRRHLQSAALLNGYRYFVNRMTPDLTGRTDQVVVLHCETDPTGLFGPGTARAFSAVSSMIAQALRPPGQADADDLCFGSGWPLLTQPERDILCYSGAGLSPEQVADRLNVTQGAVARLIRNACLKLGATDVAQATSVAVARGVVEP